MSELPKEEEAKIATVQNFDNGKEAKFYCFTPDCIGSVLMKGDIWEPHMHQVFGHFVNKDSVVIEGGCHVGTHTVKLGMMAKKVYAFEPLPLHYNLLKKNLKLNSLENVDIFCTGLSNNAGQTTFAFHSKNNTGSSGLSGNPMGNPTWSSPPKETTNVELVTIDSLKLNKLNFIKLDVEGYEPLVIHGGIETIKKCRPVIILECYSNHNGGINAQYTAMNFQMLLNIGYKMAHVHGPDFLFIPS